jgi:TadE-like protein
MSILSSLRKKARTGQEDCPTRKGNVVLEAILWIPILLLLIVGMVQLGKITYVYYSLKKVLYSAAVYISRQQGVSFCNATDDTSIQTALNFALTGGGDGTASSQFPALTSDQILVTPECVDPATQSVGQCNFPGCDGPTADAQRPDFLVLSIPDGYQVSPRIPYMLIDPILLKPIVRIPFGGT